MAKTAFKLSLWGYAPVSINLINTPGTYILITALLCYVFAIKKTSTFAADFIIASKRGLPSLITLIFRRGNGKSYAGYRTDYITWHAI